MLHVTIATLMFSVHFIWCVYVTKWPFIVDAMCFFWNLSNPACNPECSQQFLNMRRMKTSDLHCAWLLCLCWIGTVWESNVVIFSPNKYICSYEMLRYILIKTYTTVKSQNLWPFFCLVILHGNFCFFFCWHWHDLNVLVVFMIGRQLMPWWHSPKLRLRTKKKNSS